MMNLAQGTSPSSVVDNKSASPLTDKLLWNGTVNASKTVGTGCSPTKTIDMQAPQMCVECIVKNIISFLLESRTLKSASVGTRPLLPPPSDQMAIAICPVLVTSRRHVEAFGV